jgi:hypothetical protein
MPSAIALIAKARSDSSVRIKSSFEKVQPQDAADLPHLILEQAPGNSNIRNVVIGDPYDRPGHTSAP